MNPKKINQKRRRKQQENIEHPYQKQQFNQEELKLEDKQKKEQV